MIVKVRMILNRDITATFPVSSLAQLALGYKHCREKIKVIYFLTFPKRDNSKTLLSSKKEFPIQLRFIFFTITFTLQPPLFQHEFRNTWNKLLNREILLVMVDNCVKFFKPRHRRMISASLQSLPLCT